MPLLLAKVEANLVNHRGELVAMEEARIAAETEKEETRERREVEKLERRAKDTAEREKKEKDKEEKTAQREAALLLKKKNQKREKKAAKTPAVVRETRPGGWPMLRERKYSKAKREKLWF